MSEQPEKTVTEKMVDFARAVNAVDWSRVLLRAGVEGYNARMREINGKP